MLDIRTLGDHYDASILAIECVFFEPSTGKIGPQYYR
ncbi:3'-5' exoribonuclease domain-containing protein, partial [Klebsiella pneumoniae]